MQSKGTTLMKRREFLATAAATGAALIAAPSRGEDAEVQTVPQGKAEHCIFLWLGGGAGQIDTWDPKAKGDPAEKKAGSYYSAIDTAIAGTQVCEHCRGARKFSTGSTSSARCITK
jgi:hypothetical protein